MTTAALFFLFVGIVAAVIASAIWGVLSMHPTPSQSGSLPVFIFLVCVSPVCLTLAAITSIAAIIRGVLF